MSRRDATGEQGHQCATSIMVIYYYGDINYISYSNMAYIHRFFNYNNIGGSVFKHFKNMNMV